MMKPHTCPNAAQFVRLWVHESLRVFHDRLVSDDDRRALTTFLSDITNRYFPGSLAAEQISGGHSLLFADFGRPGVEPKNRLYEEITDRAALVRTLGIYLDEYNSATENPLNVVFFQDAVDHIVRIGSSPCFQPSPGPTGVGCNVVPTREQWEMSGMP
jgi:dynein heavy chain, axonemal